MSSMTIKEKLARLRSGARPRVLDLFSGCGGLMLGFHRAGGESLAGIEVDPHAASSYALNFHRNDPIPAKQGSARDITQLEPDALASDLGPTFATPDFIVGGPPCPAFTRVGRAKLREIVGRQAAHLDDPRARLYTRYLAFVRVLKPVALLMENVPDILNFGDANVGEEICETLEGLGYVCRYSILNAANYGVPQLRERFFLLAIHEDASAEPSFPAPTTAAKLPRGYEGSRRVALKHVRAEAVEAVRFVEPPLSAAHLAPAVTVREAISDLPALVGRQVKRGIRTLDGSVPYRQGRPSSYARCMREWPAFESPGHLRDHVTRALSERDYRLFEKMSEGDDYPAAIELAQDLFAESLSAADPRPPVGSREWSALKKWFIPPYDVSKFPNRWRKMSSDEPARTLMAHLGKDSYSHIHFDSTQARTITVREAARLQSFPDGFRFSGSMNAAFRQIGNAVPPLLAFELAKSLLQTLGVRVTSRESEPLDVPAIMVA